MKYLNVTLSGKSINELETEMRYHIASARIDEVRLVRFDLILDADEIGKRINGCALRVLRSLKKSGVIQYFSDASGLQKSSTEAQFILNKYSECIANDESITPYYVIV